MQLSRVDRIGACVSLMCAIHCAAGPVAAVLLPLAGIGLLASERLENAFLFSSMVLAGASAGWGIRIHHQRRVLLLFAAAVCLMAVGRAWTEGAFEMVLVILGAALILFGHMLNRRLCSPRPQCRC